MTAGYGDGPDIISSCSIKVNRGEIVAILGPNGAGKSSMLNVINGFYHPQEGEIWFQNALRGPMKPYQIAFIII